MAEAALKHSLDQQWVSWSTKLRAVPNDVWRAVVIAIALIWVCQSLAKLVWILFPAPHISAPQQMAVQAVGSAALAPAHAVPLDSLVDAQIFGDGVEGELAQVEQANAAQPAINENVEKTKLDLDLVGIVASNDADASSAVIASGKDQKIYQINDKMPVGNNVTLAKVLHDRVILSNNGNYEALWLYTETDFKVKYAYSTDHEPSRESPEPAKITAKVAPSQIPKSISEVVRFSVHREDGQMIGFRIRPGKNRALFEQMGLQANDVVTSVNGIPIDSPQAIRDHYQQLKSATAADLEIRRGEETLYINVTVDTEASE